MGPPTAACPGRSSATIVGVGPARLRSRCWIRLPMPTAQASFLFTLPSGLYNLVLFSCNGTEAGNGHGRRGVHRERRQPRHFAHDRHELYAEPRIMWSIPMSSSAAPRLTGTWYGPNGYGSLNGAQLQYFGPYVPLSIQNTNSQLKLQWSPGTLLEATNLTGTLGHQHGSVALSGDADRCAKVLPGEGSITNLSRPVCRRRKISVELLLQNGACHQWVAGLFLAGNVISPILCPSIRSHLTIRSRSHR
jgi:hypothetical protein